MIANYTWGGNIHLIVHYGKFTCVFISYYTPTRAHHWSDYTALAPHSQNNNVGEGGKKKRKHKGGTPHGGIQNDTTQASQEFIEIDLSQIL